MSCNFFQRKFHSMHREELLTKAWQTEHVLAMYIVAFQAQIHVDLLITIHASLKTDCKPRVVDLGHARSIFSLINPLCRYLDSKLSLRHVTQQNPEAGTKQTTTTIGMRLEGVPFYRRTIDINRTIVDCCLANVRPRIKWVACLGWAALLAR